MAARLASDEKARIENQIKQLGPEGLTKASEALASAKAEHDRPIPTSLIESFKIPNVENISWIPVATTRNLPDSPKAVGTTVNETDLPLFIQFESVKVCESVLIVNGPSYTVIVGFLDSSRNNQLGQSSERSPPVLLIFFFLRNLLTLFSSYLSVFQNALFSSPVRRANGEELMHDEVVDQLDRDTVSYDTSLGFGSSFTETARISIKVETEHYGTAVSWISDLLNGIVFDVER